MCSSEERSSGLPPSPSWGTPRHRSEPCRLHLRGPCVCAEYEVGSWLLWRHPGMVPSIDGRTEIYTPGQLEEARALAGGAPGSLTPIREATGCRYASSPHQRGRRSDAQQDLPSGGGRWRAGAVRPHHASGRSLKWQKWPTDPATTAVLRPCGFSVARHRGTVGPMAHTSRCGRDGEADVGGEARRSTARDLGGCDGRRAWRPSWACGRFACGSGALGFRWPSSAMLRWC